MRPFTLKTVITAVDKASKNINNIYNAANRMARGMMKDSTIAGSAFNRFTSGVGMGVKKASFHLNNLNAKINRVGRNIKNKLGTLGLAVGFTALTMVMGNTIGKFADFEQANSSLSSVMSSATGPDLKAMQVDAKRLGAITAKTSTEVVGLQEAFARLGFERTDIINMTQATINGSVAMQGELAATAELVGAMVKSFDGFESIDSTKIIDQMTLATQKSALNFEKLQTGLPIVAGAANAAGVSFTKVMASMGKLSDAGIDASSSTTALRNIMLVAASKGVPYEKLLQKVANSTDQLKVANELFGKRGAVAAVILAKNTLGVEDLDKALQGAAGTAQEAADKQLNNLKGTLTILGSAWEGYILSVEDGNGATNAFLKDTVRMATEMLSMATGTAKAESEMTKAELRIRGFAETGMTVLKVLKNIVKAFIAFKIAVVALRAATFLYNVALGIQNGLMGTSSLTMAGNTVAIAARNITMGLATAATTLYTMGLSGAIAATLAFTAALLTNPITWIILGIAALIAIVVLLVKNWDAVTAAMTRFWNYTKEVINRVIEVIKNVVNAVVSFFDKIKNNPLSLLLFPITMIVKLAGVLINSFKQIRDAFKFGSLADGFKAIGYSIINFLISPIKILLEALTNIPGVGKLAQKGLDKLNNFQMNQTVTVEEKKKKAAIDQLRISNEIKTPALDQFNMGVSWDNLGGNFAENKKADNKLIGITAAEQKQIDALNANSQSVNENSNVLDSEKNQWKGKFYTSILKNANAMDGSSSLQRGLAFSAIASDNSNATEQRSLGINSGKRVQSVSSSVSNSSSKKESITVYLVDKTGGKFGIQVESTGVNVVTTGNG